MKFDRKKRLHLTVNVKNTIQYKCTKVRKIVFILYFMNCYILSFIQKYKVKRLFLLFCAPKVFLFRFFNCGSTKFGIVMGQSSLDIDSGGFITKNQIFT